MKEEKTKKKDKRSKTKESVNNKKHRNNKTLKARYILEKNKLAEKREAEASDASPAKKIFRIVKNVILGVIIAVLAIMILSFIIVRSNGGTPTVFGYSIQRISSGSMEPELLVGDIILSKDVKDPSDIAVGDIVTFEGGSHFEYNNITHRVIAAPAEYSSGEMILTTKGDSNDVEDPGINFDRVKSKYICKLEFLNKFYDFFLSPWGLIVFIAALLIVFFDELLTVVKVLTGNYNEEEGEEEEDLKEIMDRIKREEEEEKQRLEEEAERKRRISQKYGSTSKKKQKAQKKRQFEEKKSQKAQSDPPKKPSGNKKRKKK